MQLLDDVSNLESKMHHALHDAIKDENAKFRKENTDVNAWASYYKRQIAAVTDDAKKTTEFDTFFDIADIVNSTLTAIDHDGGQQFTDKEYFTGELFQYFRSIENFSTKKVTDLGNPIVEANDEVRKTNEKFVDERQLDDVRMNLMRPTEV